MSAKFEQACELFEKGLKPSSPEVKALGLKAGTRANFYSRWRKKRADIPILELRDKRFAVAFNYQKAPKFNMSINVGGYTRYFMGDIEVMRLTQGFPVLFAVELGLKRVYASTAKEAMAEVRDNCPYNIVDMVAIEV